MPDDAQRLMQVLDILDPLYQAHPMDIMTEGNPYKVLVACILSLRTKDETSLPASQRLFCLAETPEAMVALSEETIAQTVYPVGFYRNKARTIRDVSDTLLQRFEGQVPNTLEGLLTLKGVGRKTANLVLGLGFRQPAVCVDIHVHRICNRLGVCATRHPDDTETELRGMLPPDPYWRIINRVLVLHGRAICRPIGPRCAQCPVAPACQHAKTRLPRRESSYCI
jgi:endonuclease-3